MNVASRYTSLATTRDNVLNRGRECSYLTLPFILPQSSQTETSQTPVPNNNVGARCVNNLANKLLLTLFPTSSPFFKLQVSEAVTQEMQANGEKDAELAIEKRLSELESIIQSDLEVSGSKPILYEALRHELITGNYLLHIPAKGKFTGYALDKYVVRRSHSGKVLEIILHEQFTPEELPSEWKEQLATNDAYLMQSPDGKEMKLVDIYTHVKLEGDKYIEGKYFHDILLEGSEASYKEEESAWIPLRWTGLSGENYGRSYVEEYLGSFRSLEAYTLSFKKHSAIASKIFGLIRPGSRLKPMDLARVPSGGFLYGEETDLVFPEIGKYNDMRSVQESMNTLTQDLSRAFLLTQVRDSERTTAEEIRMQANELETSLGGAYSLQASTFQEPLLRRVISRLQKSNDLPKLHDQDVSPKIIVGLDGLGRGTDLDKLMRASVAIQQIAQSAQFIPGLDMTGVTSFTFNAVGLDKDGLIKSEEEIQAEKQAQQAQMAQQQGMDVVKSAVSGAGSTLVQGAIENPEATGNAVQAMRDNIQQ